ncbi:uncharacterized protein LOC142326558 isoform X2 [Lycorma delicatula]|uniref:uncharacterized protein LOC142326558 isoform X2 n=1 Tax=Lycorma delicatula TaxID=130591 RepID=UPI003F517E7E
MFINYIILTGVILSWKGNLFPQNGIINYASAELAKQKPSSLNSFSQEKQHIYDIELVKRIIGLKKLRERYRKRQYYEARQGLTSSKNYINSILKHKLWIKDPYRAASHFRYGRKRDFSEAAYEHGVFKVKNKNYFLWVESENDYISKEFGGEIEVKDPLKGLSDSEKKEKLKFITQTHKYNAPFRDTKATNFLRGVYYSFLSKSKNTSISQLGLKFTLKDMMKRNLLMCSNNKKLCRAESIYYDHMPFMHTYIGNCERTPKLEEDNLFPSYLPVNLPDELVDYYYENVTLSKEEALTMYKQTYPSKNFYLYNANPKRVRISGDLCHGLASYRNNSKPDWHKKLNTLFRNNPYFRAHKVRTLPEALHLFYKKTGCIPHLVGWMVSLNAPYLVYKPDAIAYCRGEPNIVVLKTPKRSRLYPLSKIMGKILYLKYDKGSYIFKRKTSVYGNIQLGMGLLRIKTAYFGIYGERDRLLKLCKVRFDEPYFKDMITNIYKIYFSKLLSRLYDRDTHTR